MKEIWKDIQGYEGLYQISNLGRVKSLTRYVDRGNQKLLINEKIKNLGKDGGGYANVCLYRNNIGKRLIVHTLVWDAFGDEPRNGRLLQVDHIDNNKLNNRIDNLQLLTNRQNTTKMAKTKPKTSRFVGVRADQRGKNIRWTAQIATKRKAIYLGVFDCESLAGLAYQKALISIGGL